MYRSVFTFFVVISLAIVPFASETEVPETMNGLPLVFFEDFESGADRWEPTDPEAWSVVEDFGSKVYALTKRSEYQPPVRSPHNYSLIEGLWLTDFVIEARMKTTKEWYNHLDLCLFFGHQDAAHFYYVHIAPAPNSDPHANSVFLVNGEPRKSIGFDRNDGTTWVEGVYHKVRIVRDTESGSIEVFFDDMNTPIMKAEDKTFTFGRIGLGSFDDIGNFDNIRIWGNLKED